MELNVLSMKREKKGSWRRKGVREIWTHSDNSFLESHQELSRITRDFFFWEKDQEFKAHSVPFFKNVFIKYFQKVKTKK